MKLLLDNISASFTQRLNDSFGLFDFTPSTAAMADNIVIAVTTALSGTSLAETGQQAMHGLADSFMQFDMEAATTDVASRVITSFSTKLTSNYMKNVGYNAMLGLKQGIMEGKLEVDEAMQLAAFEAI